MEKPPIDLSALPEPYKSMFQNMDPQSIKQMLSMFDPETLSSLMNSTFGMLKNALPQDQQEALGQLLENVMKLVSQQKQ